jgi:hypothetical protein
MTTAHFQPLTYLFWWRLTHWMVGIIRVYSAGSYELASEYKFFTVGVVRGDTVTLHGMQHSNVNRHDIKAIQVALEKYGLTKATWCHDGRWYTYKAKREVKRTGV